MDVWALFTTPMLAALAAAVGGDSGGRGAAELTLPDAKAITPQMPTLVTLDQATIDRVVSRVPGGAANAGYLSAGAVAGDPVSPSDGEAGRHVSAAEPAWLQQ
jgi:hypothetical protein